MPPAASSPAPVALICGEDEFAVKQKARQLFQKWCQEVGGMDHEQIDAAAGNSGEALRAVAKLREALQTLPFFGGGKVVWFQNCSFLGTDRTSSAAAVGAAMTDLAQELKAFDWRDVRLVISAGEVDKRKSFFKTLDKIGRVEVCAGLSMDDKEWVSKAEDIAERQLKTLGKEIAPEALAKLVNLVGPNSRQLVSEAEKLATYAGERESITGRDVEAIVTRNKLARAFGLGEALGERDLPKVLKRLDEELWDMKTDRDKSAIGLLYGLISKVRTMIFVKEMVRLKWIKPEREYFRFKTQLERVPTDGLPKDRRLNPLAIHPFVLHQAAQHAQNYTLEELIAAMDRLLLCNAQLVGSRLDEALLLQQTLTQIVARPAGTAAKAA
ncbi:MAG: DNA polymerase III subunit delta [Verrucomicrobiota bacterium]